MSILHIIEILAFVAISFGLYKFFRIKKYELPTCMAIIALLFFILLVQFVFFPGNSGPSISFKGGSEIEVAVNTPYDESTVKASSGFTDLSHQVKAGSQVDTSKIGDYVVRYTLEYQGKTYYADRTIRVVDKEAPKIELTENNGFTAVDNYDGDLTDQVEVKTEKQADGKFLITYTVRDSSGNTATATRTAETLDTVPPQISLKGNAIATLLVGETYQDEGCTAADDTDGDLSSRVQSDCGGQFKAEKAGTFKIKYTVTDSSNNSSSAERIIKVINKIGYDSSTWKTEDGKGVICFTFDDGPSSHVTPANLDVLKQYNVKATFFIINYSEANRALVQREIDEGHTVGLHAYDHDYAKVYATKTSYLESIDKLHDKVLTDTGYDARIIRFPGGASNMVSSKYCPGVMGTLPSLMLEHGYLYYDWNCDSTDATTDNEGNAEAIYESVVSGLKQGRYNIVLMHDTDRKGATNEALSRIIQYGLDNGYRFEAITPETPLVCHNAQNV